MVLVTINFSTFTVPVPNAVIPKLATRTIFRMVVGHRGMSSVFSISSGWSVMRQDDRHITLVRPARRPASGSFSMVSRKPQMHKVWPSL